MADSKITALTAITTVNPATYPLVIVDTSDTSMATTGTTKKVTTNQLLGSGGTATLASATITGDLTVDTSTLKVDSANNRVGINTATPVAGVALQVCDNVFGPSLSSGIRFGNSGNNYYYDQLIVTDAGSNPSYQLKFATHTLAKYLYGGGANYWEWYTNNTLAMTLNSTGLGVGDTPASNTRLTVAAASRLADTTGQAYIRSTDAQAQDIGAQLTLGGLFNASAHYAFGGIAGRKENSTSGNVAGYLDFLTTTSAGALTSRMRIDSTGNVGIGVTSPNHKLQAVGGYVASGRLGSASTGDIGGLLMYCSTDNGGRRSWGLKAESGLTGVLGFWLSSANNTEPFSGSQVMSLDASGNLLLNATSFSTNNGKLRIQHTGLAGEWAIQTKSNTTDGYAAVFYTTTGQAGFISVSGTSATFSTSSDYRLKEAVQPLVGGLARISALKPSIYKWKADGSNGEGFLAHELAEVVPLAVTGEKDAVNEDGSIKAQGVDLSKVVPVLVAAIQELAAEVNALKNA